MKDGSDTNLAGWTIWLHEAASSTSHNANWFKSHDAYNDPIVATATTDANGNYSFANLGNGQYFVEESVTAGWKQTSDDTKVTISGANTSGTVNFANVAKSTTTPGGGNGNGNNGNGNGNGNQGNNGNHNGWFGIWGRFGSWFGR